MNQFKSIKRCTMTQKVIVLTGFAKLPDAEVLAAAGAVIKGVYVDKVLAASPPVDEATLRTSVDDLTKAIAAQAQAGGVRR
jgi:urease accessory protein UreH